MLGSNLLEPLELQRRIPCVDSKFIVRNTDSISSVRPRVYPRYERRIWTSSSHGPLKESTCETRLKSDADYLASTALHQHHGIESIHKEDWPGLKVIKLVTWIASYQRPEPICQEICSVTATVPYWNIWGDHAKGCDTTNSSGSNPGGARRIDVGARFTGILEGRLGRPFCEICSIMQ